MPQGTLSERMRAAGAGIGGFFTRTGADTKLAEGKEMREIDGKLYVFEKPLHGRFRADQGPSRRSLGQSHLSQVGAQFQSGDGDGGEGSPWCR